jgi:hypothetical protein
MIQSNNAPPLRMRLPTVFLYLVVLAGASASQDLLVSRKTGINSKSQDTSITVIRYDKDGFKVSEVTNGKMVSDWDSQGRYLGSRDMDKTEYYDRTVWVSQDSTQRHLPAFEEPIGDRYFGLRKNCWCADSIFHYRENKTLIQKRKFNFDTKGNVEAVLLVWMLLDPPVLDTGRIIHNTYDQNGRLIATIEVDRENGSDTTSYLYEYDKLENIVVERTNTSIMRRFPKSKNRGGTFAFDILGRNSGYFKRKIQPLHLQ